jgi:hypothetical protein
MRIPMTPTNTRLLAQRPHAEPLETSRRRHVLGALYEIAMFRVGMLPTPRRDVRTRVVRRESAV